MPEALHQGEADLRDMLREGWGWSDVEVRPLGGGMNSATWLVEHAGATYVAKRVAPEGLADLRAGCVVAADLASHGVVTGRPVPTSDGRLVDEAHRLAVLEHVPGQPLSGGTVAEQRLVARTLAAVHRAGGPGPAGEGFLAEWLTTDLPGVARHRWVAAAVHAARALTEGAAVTWSVVHSDPTPEAFLHDDATGTTGLVDWAGARRGPVLYDVASAVMYLGGPEAAGPFLAEYAEAGPLAADELAGLATYRVLRWTVQAAYFAWRLERGDLTGLDSDDDNLEGLKTARRRLAELGVPTTDESQAPDRSDLATPPTQGDS